MSREECNAESLRCTECGRDLDVEAHATGWLAFRVDLPDEPPVEIVVYCPDCAAREFTTERGDGGES